MADNILYGNSAINDLELVCKNGSLWYSKHILYTRCSKLQEQLMVPECRTLNLPETSHESLMQVLMVIDGKSDNKRQDTDVYIEAYLLCIQWGYDIGMNIFARLLSQIPNLMILRVLRENEDDEYMNAVGNFANQYDVDEQNSWKTLDQDERNGMVSDICAAYRRQQQTLNKYIRFTREVLQQRAAIGGKDALSKKIDELQTIYLRNVVTDSPPGSDIKKRKYPTGGEPVNS